MNTHESHSMMSSDELPPYSSSDELSSSEDESSHQCYPYMPKSPLVMREMRREIGNIIVKIQDDTYDAMDEIHPLILSKIDRGLIYGSTRFNVDLQQMINIGNFVIMKSIMKEFAYCLIKGNPIDGFNRYIDHLTLKVLDSNYPDNAKQLTAILLQLSPITEFEKIFVRTFYSELIKALSQIKDLDPINGDNIITEVTDCISNLIFKL